MAPLTADTLAHLCRAASASVDGPARAALMELADRAQALADDEQMRTPVKLTWSEGTIVEGPLDDADLSDPTTRALYDAVADEETK